MLAEIVCWLISWGRSTWWQTRLLFKTGKTLCILQGTFVIESTRSIHVLQSLVLSFATVAVHQGEGVGYRGTCPYNGVDRRGMGSKTFWWVFQNDQCKMWSGIVHHKFDSKTCVLPTADRNSIPVTRNSPWWFNIFLSEWMI